MTEIQYNEIKGMCSRICNDHNYLDDLIQEVTLIYLELSTDRKKNIKNFGDFMSTIIVRNWRSNTSRFWYKYRNIITVDPKDIYSLSEAQPETEQEECPYDILSKLVSQLYISDHNLYTDYYVNGMTLLNITEKYKIEKTYTWKTLRRIKNSLKRRVDFIYNRNDDFEDMLAPLVGKNRFTINERQLILDVYNHIHSSSVNEAHNQELANEILNRLIVDLSL